MYVVSRYQARFGILHVLIRLRPTGTLLQKLSSFLQRTRGGKVNKNFGQCEACLCDSVLLLLFCSQSSEHVSFRRDEEGQQVLVGTFSYSSSGTFPAISDRWCLYCLVTFFNCLTCMYVHTQRYMQRSADNLQESVFSSHHTWVLRMELKLSGLVTSAFLH